MSDEPVSTSEKAAAVERVARSYFAAVAAHDVEAMIGHWESGGVGHIHGIADLRAPDGYREWFGGLFRAFPDYRFDVLEVIADEERAAVRWRAMGTFDGEGRFEGLDPNGSSVDLEGCDVVEVRDGKIVDLNAYLNGAEMARQLGALPPARSSAEKALFGALNLKTRVAAALKRS